MNEKEKKNKVEMSKLTMGIVIVICLAILGISLVCFLKSTKGPVNEKSANISLNTEQDAGVEENVSQDKIYFSGFDNITADQGQKISLGCESRNSEANIVMSYQIYDENENLIYDTGLLLPGNQIRWIPSDYFDVGEHNIVFHEQPYQVIDAEQEIQEDNLKKLYYIDQNIKLVVNP